MDGCWGSAVFNNGFMPFLASKLRHSQQGFYAVATEFPWKMCGQCTKFPRKNVGVTHIFPRVKRVSISISVASRKQPLNEMAEKGGRWCLNGPVWMVEQGCLSGPAWMVEQGMLGWVCPGGVWRLHPARAFMQLSLGRYSVEVMRIPVTAG